MIQIKISHNSPTTISHPKRGAQPSSGNILYKTYTHTAYYTHGTSTLMAYKDLIKFGGTWILWSTGMCKELGRLAQGYKNMAGTNTMFFLTHKEIWENPKDCVVIYAQLVVDYRPQKVDLNRIQLTIGSNLIV